MSSSAVRVGVRVRPLSAIELAADSRLAITYPGRNMVRIGDGVGDKTFTFDNVFPSNMSQSDLFNATAAPMLQSFLDGYNVTVLAYGQTGSGKTFTMGSESGASEGNMGLIPRFLEEIFARTAAPTTLESRHMDETTAVVCNPLVSGVEEFGAQPPLVTVSFLEIYGEDIYDLLQQPDSDDKSKSLALREDNGSVSVVGLTEVQIDAAVDAMDQLRVGTTHRTTASTLMNTVSSRSHAVFTVTLRQTLYGDVHGKGGQEVFSKLSFVDLAGSERLKRTGAEGQRMKEGIQINKGLLALGNVINALADEETIKRKEKVHVGYRESKLTRLLQDALGGNSQTLFLACISPAEINLSETLSTLRYANRARNIQNKPVKNTDPMQEELRKMHELNTALRIELVKERFADKCLGPLSDDAVEALLSREDVKSYMSELGCRLQLRGDDLRAALVRPPAPALLTAATPVPARRASMMRRQSHAAVPGSLHHREMAVPEEEGQVEEGSPAFEEVLDPENDMRMINKLLEMLKHDEEFDKTKKEHEENMGTMDTEIQEKEEILEHLKHNMKQYQVLLEENDLLVRELQSLECEKSQLVAQLIQHEKQEKDDSASSNNSVAKLKDRLKSVESRLKSQAVEQKKREEAMQLVKRDSTRCLELEANIFDLKKAKVDMVKKQKDASAQFKAFMDLKNKELADSQKTRRREKLEATKLESENHKLTTMMSRKIKAHQKTEEALQRNKSHLLKLLAVRKRERQRESTGLRGTHKGIGPRGEDEVWAPEDEAVHSAKFCLLQMVSIRAAKQERMEQEHKLQAEYAALQRAVRDEVGHLSKVKGFEDDGEDADAEAHASEVVEREERLEELVVKLDLVGSALSDLHLPATEGSDDDEVTELDLVASMEAPALRTVLWSLLDGFADLEFQKRMREACVRRKEAEAAAATEKQHKLEQHNADLRRGFHERLSVLHSERIEFAQAVCSPVGKKQGQLGALHAMNSDLEEKLAGEKGRREALEVEVNEHGARAAELSERLQVAELLLKESSPSGDSTLAGSVAAIQALWCDIGVAEAERHSLLEKIRLAPLTCARGILAEAERSQQELKEDNDRLAAELRLIAKIVGAEESAVFSFSELGSSKEQAGVLARSMAAVQPLLDDLQGKVAAVQRKAAMFSAQLEAFEPVRRPLIALLLSVDLSTLFTQELLAYGGSSLPALLEKWEVEVRNLAVQVAEARTGHQADFDTARVQLQEMGKCDAAQVHELLQGTSLPMSHSEVVVASVCRCLVSLEEGGAEALSLTSHAAGVACLRACFDTISKTHAALDSVASAASGILVTFFVAVHKRLCDQTDTPKLSHERVASVVASVDSCIAKTRAACDEGIERSRASWAAQGTALEARTEFPPPWSRPTPLVDATLHLLAAADTIRAGRAVTVSWLGGLAAELGVAADEARCLSERMSRVSDALSKLSARDSLRRTIVELDGQLSQLYHESSAFEQNAKDPSRLQDRTGKGRRDLANEEAQRKQFQKNIRKTLNDMKRALADWEEAEHAKFDADVLSEHGQEVRNAKTDADISGKTQLMHLESSMQVGQPRRNSGEARRSSGEQSDSPPCADVDDHGKAIKGAAEAPTPAKAQEAAEAATPARPQGPKGQKSNPFAKMVSSRKSSAFVPQGNRSLAEGTPVVNKYASEVASIQEQENLDPARDKE